jgi:transcriptional regulator with XRE-family HTH domain
MTGRARGTFTDQHVGHRIRMRRLTLDMTQSELGREVGVTFQQIQKYELGKIRVGASRLQQIAKVLGVPIGFFFEGIMAEDTQPAPDGAQANYNEIVQLMATREGLSLAKNFMRIKRAELRRGIIALAEELASEEDGALTSSSGPAGPPG